MITTLAVPAFQQAAYNAPGDAVARIAVIKKRGHRLNRSRSHHVDSPSDLMHTVARATNCRRQWPCISLTDKPHLPKIGIEWDADGAAAERNRNAGMGFPGVRPIDVERFADDKIAAHVVLIGPKPTVAAIGTVIPQGKELSAFQRVFGDGQIIKHAPAIRR